jgi:hypothetical protein
VGEVPDSSSGDITSSVGVIEGAPRSKLPTGSVVDAEELCEVESPSSLPIDLGQNSHKSDSHDIGHKKRRKGGKYKISLKKK